MNEDLNATLSKLEGHVSALQAVIDLIGDRQYLPREDVDRVRDQMRGVKQAIEIAYRSGSTVKGEAALTDAEMRYYQPAVHETFTRLPSLSTRPGPKWLDQLFDAKGTFEWYINQIRTELGAAAG
jgi:hypothetical protein